MQPMRSVNIEVSSKCQCKCVGCYFWKQSKKKTLSNDEIKRVIDIISNMPKMKDFRLAFIGGEPTMNTHLIELAKYAAGCRMRPEILSNGYLLTKDMLKELCPYISGIQISLDFPERQSKLHDERRVLNGLWKRAYDSLQWALLLDIPRTITMTLGNHNFIYMNDMLRLSRTLGAELKILRFIPYTKADRENALTKKQNWLLCKFIKDNGLVSDTPIQSLILNEDSRCDAGINRLCVKTDGMIGPCDFVPKTFGNILKEPIESIMKKMLEWREYNLDKSRMACGSCPNWSKCWGGCLAMQTVYNNGKDMGCWV